MAKRYNSKADASEAKKKLFPRYDGINPIYVPEAYEKAKGLKMGWYLWSDVSKKHL